METVYTYRAATEVMPMADMTASEREYWLEKHPTATHVVRSPKSKFIYAICGSQAAAEEAKRKIDEVTAR